MSGNGLNLGGFVRFDSKIQATSSFRLSLTTHTLLVSSMTAEYPKGRTLSARSQIDKDSSTFFIARFVGFFID